MASSKSSSINKLSFETSLSELEDILESVDAEKVPLQELIEQFDRGTQLLSHCRTLLGEAEKKIELIRVKPESSATKSKNELAQTASLGDDSAAKADLPDDEIELF